MPTRKRIKMIENITSVQNLGVTDDFLANVMMTWVKNELNRRANKPTVPEVSGEDYKKTFIEYSLKLIEEFEANKKESD